MISNNFKVQIKKTDIINVDESTHQLPPDNGNFSEYKVIDYNCPKEWSNDGIFIPVKENEPFWIDLRGNDECVCIPSVQRVNPITGEPANLEGGLSKSDGKQNYLVLPEQKWLDGYAKEGKVYQFMITKSGESLAVNEYVLPVYMQDSHALGFAFFLPKNPKPKVVIQTEHVHHYWDNYWYDHYNVFGYYYSPKSLIPKKTKGAKYFGSNTSYGNLSGTVSPSCVDDSAISCNNVLRGSGGMSAGIAGSAELAPSSYYNQCEQPDSVINQKFLSQELNDVDKASVGMGGRIEQRIITDNNSIDYYKEKPDGILTVYLALPELFEKIISGGPKQNISKKDRYKFSGQVGNSPPIPLIKIK